MKQATFHIPKMDCPTEEQLIRNRLKSINGIDDLSFNLMDRELVVTHRLDDDQNLIHALTSIGMTPEVVVPPFPGTDPSGETGHLEPTGPTGTEPTAASSAPRRRERPLIGTLTAVLLGISGVLAVVAEVVAWTTGREDSPLVIALSLGSIALGGRETLLKGWRALRTFTLNINFLMSLAIIGAVIIGQWPEAAMVTFLFAVAELIEAYSLDRARNAIRSLMELSPEMATIQMPDGAWQTVNVAVVKVGQRVRVRPGERVPLDGVVTSGTSTVNEAPITGESMPVEKAPGMKVFAGTVNGNGSLEFEVTANRGDTTLARIIRSVQQAQKERAPTQRFVDTFARYYTPVIVVLAILVAVGPPLVLGQPFYDWFYRALVLLVIACPCALVISTPVTVVSGLAAAARQGLLIKGGVYLELGRRLKVVALDKTGTLTHGRPALTDVIPLVPGSSRDALLQVAASLDAPSEHPVASAIVAGWTGADRTSATSPDGARQDAANRSGGLLPVEGFEALTGRGVKGRVGGQLYHIGNHRLAEELGLCGPETEAVLDRLEQEGKTTVVLMSEDQALAVLGVADTLRETSVEAVQMLHDLGVRTVMLTGDNQTTANAIARRTQIDDVRGNLLPEDKLAVIEALLRDHDTVGMVGDGINDAPALAKASIGFAMGAAGTDTALETADVALMQDDLRGLPAFIMLSRRTAQVLTQNIAFALGIKVVFFGLAMTGIATLWMAVFADMGASLLVVFNGLRLLSGRKA